MRLFFIIFSIITCFILNLPTTSPVFASNNSVEINSYRNIDNFHKVDNNYYRGAQPNFYDIVSLSRLGIRTIINLRDNSNEGEAAITSNMGMKYFNVPMKPSKPPTLNQISSFLKIVSNPANQPVFVHCQHGKDRTGIMSALYRVRFYGWNFEQAYNEMRNLGYHRILFPRQKQFLYDYTNATLNLARGS